MIKKFLSEFRQNLVSGEWVLFSAGRAKGHIAKEKEAFYKPKEGCPFDDPVASRQEIVWGFPDNEKWNMMVIQNKYPAVMPGKADEEATEGLFKIHAAAGNHDIIIFREHDITPYDFSKVWTGRGGEHLSSSFADHFVSSSSARCLREHLRFV